MCQKDIRKKMETEKKLITISLTQGENQDNMYLDFIWNLISISDKCQVVLIVIMGRGAISIFIQAAVSNLCYLMGNLPKLEYTLNESVHIVVKTQKT